MVLVHDAVRPLIDPATIERTIDAVVKHGAAIVGLPAVDTIKQVERTADGAIITSTIPRERVVQAQTPQGARCGLLQRAFAEAEADGFAGTDEASLLERAGIEVAVVAGSARNFKVTQPGDLELAEFYLSMTRQVRDEHEDWYGFDSHAFKAGVPLVIGGLTIEHQRRAGGALGWRRAAACDHGRAAGRGFGGRYRHVLSAERSALEECGLERSFCRRRSKRLPMAGYRIVNIDTVLVLARAEDRAHRRRAAASGWRSCWA